MIATQTTPEDRTSDHALGVPRHPIRPCSLDDIPWLLEQIAIRYAAQPVDMAKTENYWRATIGRADHVYIRGTLSAGASRLVRPYWAKNEMPPVATDLFFFTNKTPGAVFEILAIMRMMIAWAKACGCTNYRFAAMTGADIAALAKRLGAESSYAMYNIDLTVEG